MMRAIWAVLLALGVSGCDLFEDSNKRPWQAYAWHREQQRHQWWLSTYETHRDCIEAVKHASSMPPQNQWYSAPVGCSYMGNNYWRVRIMNMLYAQSADIECIARWSDPAAVKSGSSYSAVLKGYGRPQGQVYCVD